MSTFNKKQMGKMRLTKKIVATIFILSILFLVSGCGTSKTAIKGKENKMKKQVAITVDDLPFANNNRFITDELKKKMFTRFLDEVKAHNVKVAGFLIGNRYSPDWDEYLIRWIKEGNILANHTYSHLNSNEVTGDTYVKDIGRCDSVLSHIFQKAREELNIPFTKKSLVTTQADNSFSLVYPSLNPADSTTIKKILTAPKEDVKKALSNKYNLNYKFFRFPYLNRGNTAEKKYIISSYLEHHGYQIAPVTITSNDWRFNPRFEIAYLNKDEEEMQSIQDEYLKRIMRETYNSENYAIQTFHREVKQILLFHLNILNAMSVGKIIEWYQENGWEIITLDEALKDEVYDYEDTYNGEYGIPWLFRAKRIRRTTENPIAWGN